MTKRNEQIQEQTRQKLIDGFWILYKKKDIDKIKVQEITDLAGYHRNSFYRYFEDVYDVLDQIENRIIDELMENSGEGKVFYEGEFSAKRFADVYQKNKKYLMLLADETRHGNFSTKMKNKLKPFYDKKFLFTEDTTKNAYIHEYKLSGSIAAIMYYFRGGEKLSLEEVLNLVLELDSTGKWQMKYN